MSGSCLSSSLLLLTDYIAADGALRGALEDVRSDLQRRSVPCANNDAAPRSTLSSSVHADRREAIRQIWDECSKHNDRTIQRSSIAHDSLTIPYSVVCLKSQTLLVESIRRLLVWVKPNADLPLQKDRSGSSFVVTRCNMPLLAIGCVRELWCGLQR